MKNQSRNPYYSVLLENKELLIPKYSQNNVKVSILNKWDQRC